MTNQQQQLITPPPELVEQWGHNANLSGVPYDDETGHWAYEQHIAARAAQWGADQELIACGNYLKQCATWEEEDVIEFYNYRRPKPLSLKEEALGGLDQLAVRLTEAGVAVDLDTIRRALKALPE